MEKKFMLLMMLLMIVALFFSASCSPPGVQSDADVAPDAPVVNGITPTTDATPTWTWDVPATADAFRNNLDSAGWSAAFDTATTSFTPVSDLSVGIHTLEVQARNGNSDWSVSGSYSIEINSVAPSAPVVTGTNQTKNARPEWTWNVPAAADAFRMNLDSAGWSVAFDMATTSFTPGSDLSVGTHTLEVQARSGNSDWSVSGSHSIEILPAVIAIDLSAYVIPAGENVAVTDNLDGTYTFGYVDGYYTRKFCFPLDNSDGSGSINLSEYSTITVNLTHDRIYTISLDDSAVAGSNPFNSTTSDYSGALTTGDCVITLDHLNDLSAIYWIDFETAYYPDTKQVTINSITIQ